LVSAKAGTKIADIVASAVKVKIENILK